MIAGHCIWCSEKDIGLLASRDVAVAHNPVANMILASGVCPVPRLRREGVRVGIGTDGAASNDSQDMFGAIKSAALLQKVHHLDPAAMTAPEVLRMATMGGAEALGKQGEIGSLEPGKRADVQLLDGNGPELAVLHDPFQQVVYGATPRIGQRRLGRRCPAGRPARARSASTGPHWRPRPAKPRPTWPGAVR